MKSNLLKVAKSLALFLLILFIADRAVGYVIKKLYFSQRTGDLFQTTYAVKQARQDILIFGASRAMHHYVSDIFEKRLHLSTYNLGRDGRNMLYNYAVLSQVLTYHHPSMVILDVQPDEYSWKAGRAGEDAMIYALLPYADNAAINNNISKIRKSDILLSEIFTTYAYNSSIAQILGYKFGLLTDSKNIKGYEPLKGCKLTRSELDQMGYQKIPPPSNEIINSFNSFLSLAKRNNVKVYVVVSPAASKIGNNSYIPALKNTTEKYGFDFYDFSKLKTFQDYTLFYDKAHLNNNGARLFTECIVDTLTNKAIINRSTNKGIVSTNKDIVNKLTNN